MAGLGILLTTVSLLTIGSAQMDISMTSFTDHGTTELVAGVATDLTFTVLVQANVAISDASAGDTIFTLKYQLSSADLTGTDGSAGAGQPLPLPSTLDQTPNIGFARGSTDYFYTGTLSLTLDPTDVCGASGNLHWLCAKDVPTSNDDNSDPSNDFSCIDLSAHIICKDISLTAFTDTSGAGINVAYGQPFSFDFQVELRSLETIPDASQPSDVPSLLLFIWTFHVAPGTVFALEYVYSDADMSLDLTADTLSDQPKKLDSTHDSAPSAGLTALTPVSFTGTLTLTISDQNICTTANFICVFVQATDQPNNDPHQGNNHQCLAITWKLCDNDIGVYSFTDTSGVGIDVTLGNAFSVPFQIDLRSSKTISDATLPDTVFALQYQFSDVDIGVYGSPSDSLSDPPKTLTSTLDDNPSVGFATAFSSESFTGTLTDTITDPAICAGATVICVKAVVTDALNNNGYKGNDFRCLPIATKLCYDISVTSFQRVSTGDLNLVGGDSFSFDFQVTVESLASIPDVSTGSTVFVLESVLSDVDLGLNPTGGSPEYSAKALTSTLDANANVGFTAGIPQIFTGTLDDTLQSDKCYDVNFVCVHVKVTDVAHNEVVTNDYRCLDVSQLVWCGIDLVPTKLYGEPSTAQPYVLDSNDIWNLGITIENQAPVAHTRSNVPAVASTDPVNYDIQFLYSASDGIAGAVGIPFTADFTELELQLPLYGNGGKLTLTANAAFPTMTSSECNLINYLCVKVQRASGAQYMTPRGQVGSLCVTMEATCSPDPALRGLSVASGEIISGESSSLTIAVSLYNYASNGANDIIFLATGDTTNYKISGRLTDGDNYLTSTDYAPAQNIVLPGSMAVDPMDAGGTTDYTGLTMDFTLDHDVCPDTTHLCLAVKRGATTNYRDPASIPGHTLQYTCTTIAPTCRQDAFISKLSVKNVNGVPPKYEIGQSTLSTLDFGLQTNIEIPATSGGSNFALTCFFSDKDVGIGDVDTLGLQTLSLDTRTFDTGTTLLAGQDGEMDVSGVCSVAMSSDVATCKKTQFLCLATASNGGYTDYLESNNVKCLDIKSRVSCDQAIEVVATANVPDASSPLIFGKLDSRLVTLDIKNNAPAAGVGSDISTSTVGNYIVGAQFSTANDADKVILSRFTGTWASHSADQQLGVTAQNTIQLRVDIPFPGVTDAATCNTITDACFWVDANKDTSSYFDTSPSVPLCSAVSITCEPDGTLTQLAFDGGAFTLDAVNSLTHTVTFDVHLVNLGSGNNDFVPLAPIGKNNFVLKAQFSADNTGSGGTWTDITTQPVEMVQRLEKLADITFTGLSVTLTIADEECSQMGFFCVLLAAGNSNNHVDADSSNNKACLALTDKVCRTDISVTALSELDGTPVVYEKNQQVNVNPMFTIESSIAVPAGTAIVPQCSLRDSQGNQLAAATVTDLRTNSANFQPDAGLSASTATILAGACTITVPDATCATVTKLCMTVTDPPDYNPNNDISCVDISARVSCGVGLSMALGSPSSKALVFNTEETGVTIDINIKNDQATGTGPGYDITSVSGDTRNNFDVIFTYADSSDADLGSAFATVTLVSGDLKSGLTTTGSVALSYQFTFPAVTIETVCRALAKLKVTVSPGTGASYAAAAAFDTTALSISCTPDPSLDSLASTTNLVSGAAPVNVVFDVNLINKNNAVGDLVPATTGDLYNYKIRAKFSTGDLSGSGTNTLTNDWVDVVQQPAAMTAELPPGQSAIPLSGLAVILPLSNADCPFVGFLCAELGDGNSKNYVDADPKNIACTDQLNIVCNTDISLTGVTINDNPPKAFGSTLNSNKATVGFDLGTDVDIAVSQGNNNFNVFCEFSNVNLGGGGTNALSASRTPMENIGGGFSPTMALQTASPGNYYGTCSLDVSANVGECSQTLFLCVTVTSDTQTDPNANNDVSCEDIRDRVSCDASVKAANIVGLPSQFSPLIKGTAFVDAVTVTIINSAAAGGQGSDITPVTGASRSNFLLAFSLQSSTNQEISEVVVTGTSTLPAALQSGLAKDETLGLSYTLNIPAITDTAVCNQVHQLCVSVSAAAGASFVNFYSGEPYCKPFSVTCAPDPQLTQLAFTAPAAFVSQSDPQDISFDAVLTNGNNAVKDIVYAANTNLFNYKVKAKFSVTDVSAADDDGKNWVEVSTQPPAMRQELASTPIPITGMVVSLSLTDQVCQGINFFCVNLVDGDSKNHQDDNPSNNIACQDATSAITCRQDIAIKDPSLTANPRQVFLKSSAITVPVSFTLRSNAAVAGATDLISSRCEFSDVDLSLPGKVNTIPSAQPLSVTNSFDPNAALAADTDVAVTGECAMTVPDTLCKVTSYICIISGPGAYTDSDETNNVACFDIAELVSCNIDLLIESVVNLPDISSPLVIGDAATVTLKITLTNKAPVPGPGSDVPAVLDPFSNFLFNFEYHDDKSASAVGSPLQFTPDPAELRRGIPGAGTLEFNIPVEFRAITDEAECNSISELCMSVNPAPTAGYAQASSSVVCQGIEFSCSPNPQASALTLESTDRIMSGSNTAATVSVDVTNTKTGANDIVPGGSGPNFSLRFVLSDGNLGEGGENKLGTSWIELQSQPAELSQTLEAGKTIPISGIDVTIPLEDAVCPLVQFLCVELVTGVSSNFKDAVADNTFCTDVVARLSCLAAIEASNLKGLPDASLPISANAATSGIPCSLDLTNQVPVSSPAFDITAVTDPDNNFDIQLYLYDGVDQTSNLIPDTLPVFVQPSDLRQALAADGTVLTISGSLDIPALSKASCVATESVCAKVSSPNSASYHSTDSWTCAAIAACPNVEATRFADASGAPILFQADVVQSFSYLLTFRSDTKFVEVPDGRRNFETFSRLSDVDIGVPGEVDSLILGDQPMSSTLDSVPNQGLAANTDKTVTGTIQLTIPFANCKQVNYLCGCVRAPADPTLEDDCACIDIRLMKTCDVVLDASRLTGVPDETDPLVVDKSRQISVGLTLTNNAPAPGLGSDISTLTGTDTNYKVTLMYSTISDWSGTVGQELTPDFTVPERQIGLPGGGSSLLLDGQVTLPALDQSSCNNVEYLCARVEADIGNGAMFRLAQPGLVCEPIVVTCFPDPAPTALEWVSGTITSSDASTSEISVKMKITNLNKGANDIIFPETAPNTNYEITLRVINTAQLSDSPDSVIADEAVSYPAPFQQEGLLPGDESDFYGDFTASFDISDEICQDATLLCAVLSEGDSTHYLDAVKTADNLAANADCIDVASHLVCRQDVQVSGLTIENAPAISYLLGTAASIGVSFKLSTNADVPATQGGSNFAVTCYFSDVDMSTGTNTLTSSSDISSANFSPSDGLSSSSNLDATGTCGLTVPNTDAECKKTSYLCVESLSAGGYTDSNLDNNVVCILIAERVSCDIAVATQSVAKFPDSSSPLVFNSQKEVSVDVVIKNEATQAGPGSNIHSISSGANYIATFQYSSASTLTPVGASFTGVFADNTPLQRGMDAQESITLSPTVTFPSLTDAAACNSITHACVTISPDVTGGSAYLETSPGSPCFPITISCTPDPRVINPSLDGTDFVLSGTTASSVAFSATLDNPSTGNNDVVYAASSPHYILQAKLSDVNIGAGETDALGSDWVIPVTQPEALKQELGKSSELPLNNVAIDLLLTDSMCPYANFLCVELVDAKNGLYLDLNGGSVDNTACMDFTARRVCHADVVLSDLALTNSPPDAFVADIASPNVAFSFKLTSNAYIPATQGGDNFVTTCYLSDADGASSVNLGTSTATITSQDFSSSMTMSADTDVPLEGNCASMTISKATCSQVIFLCVSTYPSNGYNEGDSASNAGCVDISDRVSCDIDAAVSLVNGFPDASSPMVIGIGQNAVTIKVDITNSAPAAGQGSDIAQIADPYFNFAFQGFYSSATPFADVGINFDVSCSDADRRSGLVGGGGSMSITCQANLPAVTDATVCNTISHACVGVMPDIAGGARWRSASSRQPACGVIEFSCTPNPQPDNLALKASSQDVVSSDGPSSLLFDIDITNPAQGPNDLVHGTSLVNFKLEAVISDQDLSIDGNTNSLATTWVEPAAQPAELQQTLPNGGTISISDVSVDMSLTDLQCPSAAHFCVRIVDGTSKNHVDVTTGAANTKCAPFTKKVCRADVTVTSLMLTAVPAKVFLKNVVTSTPVSFTLRSNAPIADVNAPSLNFGLECFVSDKDVSAGDADSLNISPQTVTVSGFGAGQALAADTDLPVSGACDVTVPEAKCAQVLYLCTRSLPSDAYVDSLVANNVACDDVRERISCDVAVSASKVTGFPSATPLLLGQDSQPLDVVLTVKNNAPQPGQGSNIAAVQATNRNFAISLQYSSASTLTPVDSPFGMTNPDLVQLQQALSGQGEITISGTVTFPAVATAAECNSITHACVTISPGVGASYLEAAPVPFCDVVSFSCQPDPKPTVLDVSSGVLLSGPVANSLTLDLTIVNQNSGRNDVIPPAPAGATNYQYDIFLSDQNVGDGGSDTLGLSPVRTVIPAIPAAEWLTNSGTLQLTGATASISFSDTQCSSVQFLCAALSEGNSGLYVDADKTANTVCADVTAIKTCRSDLDMLTFTETASPPATFLRDVATSFEFGFSFTTDFDIASVTGQNDNYVLTSRLSDVNLRTSGDTDTLAQPLVPLTTTLDTKAALIGGQKLSGTGTAQITVPKSVCTRVRYLCIISMPSGGYVEALASSNVRCTEIKNRVTCGVDLMPSDLTGVPVAASPLVVGRSLSTGVSVTVTSTTAAGPGLDITSVRDPYSNFKFTMYYSSAATLAQVGSPFSPVFPANDLRQGLVGGELLQFTGTVEYPAISAGCETIAYVCIAADADDAGGATFRLETVNTPCFPVEVTCAPDPNPVGATISTTIIKSGPTAVTVSLDLDIENLGTGANDFIPVADNPLANYAVELQYATDTQGSTDAALAAVTPTFTQTDVLSAALQPGEQVTWPGLTASLTLPDDICPRVTHLCASLSKGTSDKFVLAAKQRQYCALLGNAKSCRPVLEVLTKVKGSIRVIGGTFSTWLPAYADSTSTAFQRLADVFTTVMDKEMKAVTHILMIRYKTTVVLQIRPGSVIVDYEIEFTEPINTYQDYRPDLKDIVNSRVSANNGFLGDIFEVDNNSTSFYKTDEPLPDPTDPVGPISEQDMNMYILAGVLGGAGLIGLVIVAAVACKVMNARRQQAYQKSLNYRNGFPPPPPPSKEPLPHVPSISAGSAHDPLSGYPLNAARIPRPMFSTNAVDSKLRSMP